MATYCYPYKRGTGWRSQEFRSHPESPFNPSGGHTGFDQAMDAGTPLYAPADGIVRNSSWLTANYLDNPWWLTQFGGDTLVIDCYGPDGTTATGPTFIFAHLADSIAPVGAKVTKRQLVALSGNSGTATTGPHVHVEALPPNWDWNNGVYGRVDPESYFTEWPEDIGSLAPQGSTTKPTPAPIQKDWFDMATEEQLRKIVREEGVGYKNPALEKDDVYAIIRATRTLAVQNKVEVVAIKSLLSQLAKNQGTPIDYVKVDQIVKENIDELAASVITADINLNVNGKAV